ncbi:unnamed protein product, partial [Allacma fusca]
MEFEKNEYKCYEKARTSKYGCITYGTFAEYAILRNFTDRFGKSDVFVANSREFFVAVGPMV